MIAFRVINENSAENFLLFKTCRFLITAISLLYHDILFECKKYWIPMEDISCERVPEKDQIFIAVKTARSP